jgi:glycosyltransferase involved in cell wall biosynthesis
MKILYHHRTRGAAVEGVHIRSIANALRAEGHHVDIMSFPGADPEVEENNTKPQAAKKSLSAVIIGIITKRFPEFMFEFLELAYNLVAWARIHRYVRTEKPDAIYERYSLFMFITVWLARRHCIPIVLEINDSALLDRIRPLLFVGIAKSIEKWIFKNSSGLVFISSFFIHAAKSAYGDIASSIISPNAADISLFNPDAAARNTFREEHQIDDKVVCGFVGAFLPWHGIHLFVDKVAEPLKQNPQLVLLLVGDGPLYEETKVYVDGQGLQKQIIFTGRVPHRHVSKLMSAMDFAILPDSNTYGSPMKLFESMAMGVPMVCPAYSPITDIVEDGKTGWLFEPKAYDKAVAKAMEISQHQEEVVRVGEAARQYIFDQRQWKHNAVALLGLYQEVGSKIR